MPTTWLELPGSADNNASVEHKAAQSVTGDIELWAWALMANWSPSALKALVGKSTSQYWMGINTLGRIYLAWYDGADAYGANSTTGVGFTNGTAGGVKATLDVDNDASGYDVKFYTSADFSTWTQLGSTVTSAGVTAIGGGSNNLYVGTLENTSYHFAGRIYEVRIYNGIGGTLVCDPKFWNESRGTTSFTESSDQEAIVTVNQSGSSQAEILAEWGDISGTASLGAHLAGTATEAARLTATPSFVRG